MFHLCVFITAFDNVGFPAFQARRFITLVDELYNYHCSLICTAAACIDDLFQGTEEGKLFDLERQVCFLVLLLHVLLPCA